MAVSVVSSPSQYNFLNSSIAYVLNMTGIVSGTVTKTFAYRLDEVGGGSITPDLTYSPTEGVDFTVSFEKDIFAVLATATPINANPIHDFGYIRDEPEMIKEFELVYWEVSFDSSTCESTLGGESTGPSFFAVNGSASYFNNAGPTSGFQVLSPRPVQHRMCRDMKDVFYVLTTGSVTLGATLHDVNGGNVGDLGPISASGGKVMSFNLGLPSAPVSDTVEYMSIYVGAYDYTIKLKDCCETHIAVTFQAQHGGYCSMAGKLVGLKPVSKSDEVFRTRIWNETGKGGVLTANKETFMEYTLEFKALIVDENRDKNFYEQFMASGHYYLLLPNNYTTDLIPDKVQISAIGSGFTWNPELRKITANFRLHVPHSIPNSYY